MRIYIPFYSRGGNTESMAKYVAEGVRQVEGAEAILAFVGDPCTPEEIRKDFDAWHQTHERLMDEYPRATIEDLAECDGACFGSPTRYGNAAGPMSNFFDMMGPLWVEGSLEGKPAGCFTSSNTMHGGQETTIFTMWAPIAHLGMIIVPLGYIIEEIHTTQFGGTPYGPSHVAGRNADRPVDETEATICRALGKRVTEIAVKLA